MRKIIKGKMYDTDTAVSIGDWGTGYRSDLDYCGETLYRKRTGEYFVHGEGGARSKYAQPDFGGWSGGSAIVPLSYDAAREWAERHLDADTYETEFGKVSEGEAVVSARVSLAAKRALEREAVRTGETQARVVERLLESLGE